MTWKSKTTGLRVNKPRVKTHWGHLDSEGSDTHLSTFSEVSINIEDLGQFVSLEDFSPYVSIK